MTLLKEIERNQTLPDGNFYLTLSQLRIIRRDRVILRRCAWKLMREFKRRADVYCIKTRFNKPYRAMKQFFQDRKGR